MGKNPDGKVPKAHSRRDVFKLAGGASALVGTGPVQAQAAPTAVPDREALETLTATEADILEAFCSRLIPSDANGPGAKEARAAHYIDRALGGAPSRRAKHYRSGLMALDAQARESSGRPFGALDTKNQDALLTELEKTDPGFFNLVRQHTLQGTFCDPYYGGNANFVGWDLLAYPGIRMFVSEQDEAQNAHPTPVRKSAYDLPMFDRHNAGIADRMSAPVDLAHMPYGMGNSKNEAELKMTDVVIVGMGATGGVAALPLARAGLEVIGLEAGTWLSPSDFAPDELRNNYRGWPQLVQKANHEVPTHRRRDGAPYSPRPSVHPMMNAVGGTTVHFWGQSWRLNPWDFKVVSATTARYGASRIPSGSTVEDWPFGLEELEPYYDKVEYEVGISGQAGNVKGKIDERGNVFEGARTRKYPMPPLHGTGFTHHDGQCRQGDRRAPFSGGRRHQCPRL